MIDCANGAAYKVAPEVLWELGADIVTIGVSPDGININLDCGSTAPQAMCNKVREVRADFGIALDGDADRVVMADEQGRIIDGDQILALIAKSWSKSGKLKGGGVVGTVMSNAGLDRYLKTLDLTLARSAVGDRYVLEEMAKGGFNVGGEQSGHIILSDFSTTGDGLIAALQVLAVLAAGRQARLARRRICSSRCPRCWRMCASRRARRWTMRRSSPASKPPMPGWAPRAACWCASPAPSR